MNIDSGVIVTSGLSLDTVSSPPSIEYLVVAGGGAGTGGGGGAGGYLTNTVSISPGRYTITVGSGGTSGGAGNNSSVAYADILPSQ